MTREEIEQQIAGWQDSNKLLGHFVQKPEELEQLLAVVFDDSKKRNWVAAWILDKINEQEPKLLKPVLPQIAAQVGKTANLSKLRHYLKILSSHTVPTHLSGELFEQCFLILTLLNGE